MYILPTNWSDMSTIDILGEQEETLGTAEDLREEIVVEVAEKDVMGSLMKIQFETSLGLCTGYYTASELGHEEINLDTESMDRLLSIFTTCNGAFMHQFNRDWVEISLAEQIHGLPEYKIYSRVVAGGAVQ